MKHKLTVEQRQLLSQNQISSLELLALCNCELNRYMEHEYMENPLLEQINSRAESYTQEDYQAWYQSNYCKPLKKYCSFLEEGNESSSQEFDASNTKNIYTYIYEQLELERYTDKQLSVIDFLIQCLDRNGFIDLEVPEIAQLTGVNEQVIKGCLSDLKKLEPYGIFAKNLAECLLIQIEILGLDDEILKKYDHKSFNRYISGEDQFNHPCVGHFIGSGQKIYCSYKYIESKAAAGVWRERKAIYCSGCYRYYGPGWEMEYRNQ